MLFLFPILQGLVILPLDLLVSQYSPWNLAGTILLKNSYMQDSIMQLFPWRHFLYVSFQHFSIPLWNPYQQLGMPFMAILKPMAFYPLNAVFLLGEIHGWNALLFLQIFLSLCFAYLLGREFVLDRISSMFFALAFSLNSYMIGLLEFGSDAHTLIWWPLILFFLKKYIDTKKIYFVALYSIFFAFSLFAGQLQYVGYFCFVLVGFVIVYGKKKEISYRDYLMVSLGTFLGVGLSAIQIIPAIELFHYSHRGLLDNIQNFQNYTSGLIPVWYLFRLFSPDFFGNPVTHDVSIGYIETSGYFGIIPLFFALIAMLRMQKNTFVKFFTFVFIIGIALSLQGVGILVYILKIPLITSGVAGRIFTIILFSGAMLAGFGLNYVLQKKNWKELFGFALVFLITYLLIIFGYKVIHKEYVTFIHNISFSAGIFLAFLLLTGVFFIVRNIRVKRINIGLIFGMGVLVITFFDFFRFGYRFITFSNTKFLYPETPAVAYLKSITAKTMGRVYGFTEPEVDTYFGLYSLETYNPLYLLKTAKLMQALQGIPNNQLSVDNKYILSSQGKFLKRTFDFLGVSYIVIGKYESPSVKYFKSNAFDSSLQKVYEGANQSIYSNRDAFPRFALYYSAKVIPEENAQLQEVINPSIDLRKQLIINTKLPLSLKQGTGSAELVSSSPDTLVFSAFTTKPALFYLSDTFFPGWHVFINGKESYIYKADYNFRAVLLPKGKSTIVFTYMPLSYIVGIGITFFSFVIFLIVILSGFFGRIVRRNKNK